MKGKKMQKTVKDAEEKLRGGVKEVKGNHERAVAQPVADMLCSFCRQDEGFAAAVIDRGATLAECLKEIMKGVGASISDVEVYRRAAEFWVPGAEVVAEIRVTMPGGQTAGRPAKREGVTILSLEDLL